LNATVPAGSAGDGVGVTGGGGMLATKSSPPPPHADSAMHIGRTIVLVNNERPSGSQGWRDMPVFLSQQGQSSRELS